ncbi:hypothetical protein RhiirA4_462966 [Rhizophagus irregularis]|uniref:Uncharacterized protein n=1 Tax=Rhizophagus irregularis TaxID=588596 RepID=A0A2I1GM07_9GLOM|nr:hypothetical protein RhiirA4_462966 [Rhizophagus irregularis]
MEPDKLGGLEGLVDGKEVIVAFVDQPEEEPVHLPAEFEGITVLISYEALVLYHRSSHKDLIIPIHLILGDVKNKFNSAVFTLKEDVEESWAD